MYMKCLLLLLLFESVCVREYAWALCICSNGTVGTFGYLQHFCFRGPQQLRANASDRERCIERLLLTRHKKQKNHRRWGYETTLSSLNIHFFALPLCAVTSPCYMTKYDNANCTDGRGTSTVLVSGLAITVTSSWRLAAARPSHCGVNVRVCCISYADSICYSFFLFVCMAHCCIDEASISSTTTTAQHCGYFMCFNVTGKWQFNCSDRQITAKGMESLPQWPQPIELNYEVEMATSPFNK